MALEQPRGALGKLHEHVVCSGCYVAEELECPAQSPDSDSSLLNTFGMIRNTDCTPEPPHPAGESDYIWNRRIKNMAGSRPTRTSDPTSAATTSFLEDLTRCVCMNVSIVFATKLKSFNFMPLLKNLPAENRLKPVWEKGSSKLSEAVEDHGTREEKTTDEGNYKAHQEISKSSETQPQKSTAKSAVASEPTTAVAHAEISCTKSKPSTGALATADNKQHGSGVDINSGLFLNSASQREEEVLSPVSSVELFTSPFSSNESILSQGWEHETGWSALQMLSPSGSLSPCSVRSGAFTPSVLRLKCHKLAPASSLIQMPLTSCQTHDCNRHITSPCPLSSRARHRPPPSQLSLLTAILRKGRLPVLSSALQRPYSPCWPISPVNMSSCMACSAASSVAPMVGLRAKSKCTMCTEPSCKTRLKPTGLIAKTEPVLSKDQIKGEESIDANSSNTYAARSRILPKTESRSFLSSYTPLVPISAHLNKENHKGIHESTDPSLLLVTSSSRPTSFSPTSNLAFQIEGDEHSTSPIWNRRNANSCQTSFSDLKLMQVAHKRSPTPDPLPKQQSQVTKCTVVSPEPEKTHSLSCVFQHPTSPKVAGFTHHSTTPSISPAVPSPRPDSCTSTSDRYTISPAIPYHHLSPSPSYSLSSSPTSSLRDASPDRIDRGSKKPYKIKSAYKALAAIPTNTLLLEQQVIDDDLNKKDAPLNPGDSFVWEDPRSQMCSPAQLQQQSAELYQVIDEVLKDSKRAEASSPSNKLSVRPETTRKLTPSPSARSLGRETKYAAVHHQPPDHTEKTLTKPGVIKPAVVMSRLADKEKSSFLNLY